MPRRLLLSVLLVYCVLFIVMTAAQNEIAFGDITQSGKGSLFTQALYDTLMESHHPLSFQALRDRTSERIRKVSRRFDVIAHTPQLEGNPALFQQSIRLSAASLPAEPGGAVAEATRADALFDQLINSSKFLLAIQTHTNVFLLGNR